MPLNKLLSGTLRHSCIFSLDACYDYFIRELTFYITGCCFSIPSLLPTIQDRLLDSISLVLSKSHYSQARPAAPLVRGNMVNIPQQVSDLNGSALVQLALQTLARFNFKVCI